MNGKAATVGDNHLKLSVMNRNIKGGCKQNITGSKILYTKEIRNVMLIGYYIYLLDFCAALPRKAAFFPSGQVSFPEVLCSVFRLACLSYPKLFSFYSVCGGREGNQLSVEFPCTGRDSHRETSGFFYA